jgi:hypothetical protein
MTPRYAAVCYMYGTASTSPYCYNKHSNSVLPMSWGKFKPLDAFPLQKLSDRVASSDSKESLQNAHLSSSVLSNKSNTSVSFSSGC